MNTIYLDRAEIEEKIIDGDNAYGRYVLAVAPDGSDAKIYWANNSRPWDDWPDGWLYTPLPSIYPEGSGRDTEDALDILSAMLSPEEMAEAQRRHDEDEATWVELVEELLPEAWEEGKREYARELAHEWLWGLNGAPTSLDVQWGGHETAEGWEPNEAPAQFEWAVDLGQAAMTPAEVAAATGTNESTWRYKIGRGEVPGAVKKGKQWLIPRAWLRSQGYKV